MTQELRITRGYPGTGKSTYAKTWVAEDPANRVRVNRDDLRAMLFDRSGVLKSNEETTVSEAQQAQVKALLAAGRSVIVDDTNLVARFARVWADIAAKAGVEFNVIDFNDVDLDTAIAWDKARSDRGERAVGEDVIRKLHKRFPPKRWPKIKARSGQSAEAVVIEPYVRDWTLPHAYIVDVDGTLAHMNGRSPFDYDRCGEDTVDHAVALMVAVLKDRGFRIIIMSGRTESHMLQTKKWLDDNSIHHDELHMRRTGDDRADWVVKSELFDKYIRNRFCVLGTFDDRDQVVEMWRNKLGIKCFQVEYGNF